MASIVVNISSTVDQTAVTIADGTDWTALGVPRSTLTSLVLTLYGTSLITPLYTYTLSAGELAAFVADGVVEIAFLDAAGTIYIEDSWWSGVLSGNTGAYVSNYSGFGIYASITYAVYSQVNSLHTPQEIKFNVEKYAIMVMFLEGMKYLDTTNVNSRGVKFQKRLISLQKMLLNI